MHSQCRFDALQNMAALGPILADVKLIGAWPPARQALPFRSAPSPQPLVQALAAESTRVWCVQSFWRLLGEVGRSAIFGPIRMGNSWQEGGVREPIGQSSC
jgi:hypothetical protein